MAFDAILLLVVTSLLGVFRLKMKYDHILSWFTFFIITYIFVANTLNLYDFSDFGFQFLWSRTKLGDINIGFTLNQLTFIMVAPIIFLSYLSIFNNNIFHYEERRSPFNTVIILNAITLCLLIGAENYLQLITAVFVSDILGYLILKDVDASHRFVIYNFFADMCLFMILALVCGKLQSLNINNLLNYQEIGRHKDYVSLVTAFSIFVKIGCFPFHNYLFDLSKVRFQRMSLVNLLFSPLSGLILLCKLHNILTISEFFIPLYHIISIASFVVGGVYFVVKNNILRKMISLNMMFLSLFMQMLYIANFNWNIEFTYYYIITFFINLMFFKIYLFQNRENNVSDMLNSSIINSKILKTVLIQIVVLMNVFITLSINFYKQYKSSNMLIFSTIIFIFTAIVLNHIYKSPHKRRLDYLNHNNLRALSIITNIVLFMFITYILKAYNLINLAIMITFIAIILLPLVTKLRTIYKIEQLQTEDIGKSFFYYFLEVPFTYISRKLWVMIDFVISEKIITSAIEQINRQSISLFFKINPKSVISCIFFILLGIVMFIYSFQRGKL